MSRVVHLRTVFPLTRTFIHGRFANDLISKSAVRPASTASWCLCCGKYSQFQRYRSNVTRVQASWYSDSKYPVCASIDSFFYRSI